MIENMVEKLSFSFLAMSVLLTGCAQESNLVSLLKEALPSDLELQHIESCTSFLGLGPAVALFSVSQSENVEAKTPVDSIFDTNSWTRHDSMVDFMNARSRATVGIGATLLDGKPCIRDLTREADLILFGERPGRYYASENEQVVIVIFDQPKDTGVMFVQAP